MQRRWAATGGLFALLGAAGSAAAASGPEAGAATSLVVTLIGVAVLVWVLGNLLTYHRYDSGGPKGGPLSKP